MSEQGLDLAALRRSSTRAGLVSLVGALLVFGGLGLGAYRVATLQEEIAGLATVREAKAVEVAALSSAEDALRRENEALAAAKGSLLAIKEALEEERLKLNTEVEGLRAERDRLREGMMSMSALVGGEAAPAAPASIGLGSGKSATKWSGGLVQVRRELEVAMPLSVRIQPRASVTPLDGGRSTFALWLEMPEDLAGEIERVNYLFNHPSFRDQNRTISEREGGFLVSYVGWGCLDSVVLTIQRKSGERDKWVVNPCQLLEKEGTQSELEPNRGVEGATGLEPRAPTLPGSRQGEAPPELGQRPSVGPLERPLERPPVKLPVPSKQRVPPG